MRSTIAAFLMSVPLSAIGLMAIFGIPQMAPGSLFNKSAPDEEIVRGDYFDEEEPGSRRRRGRGDEDRHEDAAPAFGSEPAEDQEHASASRSSRPARNAFASRGGEEFSDRQSRNGSSASAFAAAEGEPRQRLTETRSDLTWKSARQRLSELGVTHFHLERGVTDDSFLFVCMFSPGDDPRVTRRFEAEAPEPLTAVDGVLHQIDGWMQKRFENSSSVGVSYAR